MSTTLGTTLTFSISPRALVSTRHVFTIKTFVRIPYTFPILRNIAQCAQWLWVVKIVCIYLRIRIYPTRQISMYYGLLRKRDLVRTMDSSIEQWLRAVRRARHFIARLFNVTARCAWKKYRTDTGVTIHYTHVRNFAFLTLSHFPLPLSFSLPSIHLIVFLVI